MTWWDSIHGNLFNLWVTSLAILFGRHPLNPDKLCLNFQNVFFNVSIHCSYHNNICYHTYKKAKCEGAVIEGIATLCAIGCIVNSRQACEINEHSPVPNGFKTALWHTKTGQLRRLSADKEFCSPVLCKSSFDSLISVNQNSFKYNDNSVLR